MARLYANENMQKRVVQRLRDFGHDVMTTRDAGRDNRGEPDSEVLAFATREDRIVVTTNRKDFFRLHDAGAEHAGIVVCTHDIDCDRLAAGIHHAVESKSGSWMRQVVRVYKPSE